MSTIVYQGTRLNVERSAGGRANADYDVTLIEGSWPSDKDLITLCDNDHPSNPRHFGGRVTQTGAKTKRVTVYVD